MSETQNKTPEIITATTLNIFKEELLHSLGLTIGGKSLVQEKSLDIDSAKKVYTSIISGTGHQISSNKGLNNIFITGQGNIAAGNNQTVIGQFNIADPNALFIVGNGVGDTVRNNSFEVLRDGSIKIQTAILGVNTTGDFVSKSKINYHPEILVDAETLKANTDSLVKLKQYIDTFSDGELLPAGIIKQIIAQIPITQDITAASLKTFIKDIDDAQVTASNADQMALSVASARALRDQLAPKTDYALITQLNTKVALLEQKLSYLISSLTVDKITNADYKNPGDELIEIYSVGVADYALDADTEFTFDITTQPSTGGNN